MIENRLDTEAIVDAAPINPFHIFIWVIGTSVVFIDGFNIQVMGYLMPKLVDVWRLPHGMVGPIVSSGLLGVFIGYIALAPLAARVGHRRMIVGCTLLVGIGTIATTWASEAYSMMALRFVTGIALGASNPSAFVVISDFIPKRLRSTFIAAAVVGTSLGSLAAGQVAIVMLDRFGWQGVLWVGGLVPLALAATLFLVTPDTLDYLINRKGDQAAALKIAKRVDPKREFPPDVVLYAGTRGQSASLVELFKSGRSAGTISIWLAFASNLVVYYFIQSWLALILKAAGYSQNVALNATSAFLLGGTISFLVIGPLMDRFSPYKILAGFFAVGAVMVVLLGSMISGGIANIIALTLLLGFFVSGVQKGMHAICVYYYPTALRATGLGWGLGIGRVGAVLGPTLAGWLTEAHVSTQGLFYWSAAPLLLGACAQLAMLRGQPPQQP